MSATGSFAVIAHRGAAAEAPENTLHAFDLAIELGADALELDVRRAADGRVVVIHDRTLDRTTDARGAVAASGTTELRELGVPALDEVFERYPEMEITVDVKEVDATEDVLSLIDVWDRTDRTILYVDEGTDTPQFLGYEGRRATSVAQAAELAELVFQAGSHGRAIVPDGFPEVIHAPLAADGRPIVSEPLIAVAHTARRSVQVWTVDDTATMNRLWAWGADGIITNDVRAAVRLRADLEA